METKEIIEKATEVCKSCPKQCGACEVPMRRAIKLARICSCIDIGDKTKYDEIINCDHTEKILKKLDTEILRLKMCAERANVSAEQVASHRYGISVLEKLKGEIAKMGP